MIRRTLAYVFVTELIALVLIMLGSWTASMVGLNTANLFEEEGLRWFFLHLGELIDPSYLCLLICIMMVVGAVHHTGLLRFSDEHRKERLSALIVGLVLSLLFLMPVLVSYSPLLSVTGQVQLSPWMALAPYAYCFIILLVSGLFALRTRQAKSPDTLVELYTAGLREYALLLPICMLGNLLYGLVLFCF